MVKDAPCLPHVTTRKVVTNVFVMKASLETVSLVWILTNALPVTTTATPMPLAIIPQVVSNAHVTLVSLVTVKTALTFKNVLLEWTTVPKMQNAQIPKVVSRVNARKMLQNKDFKIGIKSSRVTKRHGSKNRLMLFELSMVDFVTALMF